jgi:hypothetical protein
MRTSKEWRDWYAEKSMAVAWPVDNVIDDLAAMEAERDALQADSTKAIVVVAGLIAERDEWKAKGEKLAEAVERIWNGSADTFAHELAETALEEWRNP